MYCVTQRLVLTVNKAPEDCFLLSDGFFFSLRVQSYDFFFIFAQGFSINFYNNKKKWVNLSKSLRNLR